MQFPSIPGFDDTEIIVSIDVIDVDLPSVLDEQVVSSWLLAVAKTYDKSISSMSYVLCSDAYLLEMNVERLAHDTYTDIITFDLGEPASDSIEGECYISLERVNENASSFGESTERELLRVVVHGLLHLCGLGDKSEEEAKIMRLAEETALEHYFI